MPSVVTWVTGAFAGLGAPWKTQNLLCVLSAVHCSPPGGSGRAPVAGEDGLGRAERHTAGLKARLGGAKRVEKGGEGLDV